MRNAAQSNVTGRQLQAEAGRSIALAEKSWQAVAIEPPDDLEPIDTQQVAGRTSEADVVHAASRTPMTRKPRYRKRDIASTTFALLLLAFCSFMVFYPFPKVIFLPGTADSVGERLKVEGPKEYDAKGKILWATVSQKFDPRFLDMVDAWLKTDRADIEDKEKELGDLSPSEAVKFGRLMMDNSKQTAAIVTARRLKLPITPGAVNVEKTLPASNVLKAGDEIQTVDGQTLCLTADLRKQLAKRKPGDTVPMTIRRGTKTIDVQVPLAKAPDGRAIIGIVAGPSEKQPCKPSFKVNVETGQIGGPSAGLAMTLAMLDRLTPGELTGGLSVAATGTIEPDATIGEIGGVKQKTFAVKAAGAKVFFVPFAEEKLSKPYAGSMKVIGVKTLDDVLVALEKLGGDPLPKS